MEDLHNIGGVPAVLKYLMLEGYIEGDVMTVTGKTLGENLENVPNLPKTQSIIYSVDKPIKPNGHVQILKGMSICVIWD